MLGAVEVAVDRTAGQVHKLAVEIGGKQAAAVAVLKVLNIADRKVGDVLSRASLDQFIALGRVLHPAVIDKAEAFGCGHNADSVAHLPARCRVSLLAVTGYDLVPDSAGLVDWQRVQFVNHAMRDFIADDPIRLFHVAKDDPA